MPARALADPTSLETELEYRRRLTAQLAGDAVGRWLRALEIEGRDIEPVLERVLNDPYRSTTISTTDGEKALRENLKRQTEEFESSLTQVLGYVPERFRFEENASEDNDD